VNNPSRGIAIIQTDLLLAPADAFSEFQSLTRDAIIQTRAYY